MTDGYSTTKSSGQGEQCHLGAGLWNRGSSVLGFYGQWHGPVCGDRRLVAMDLGLVISNDGVSAAVPSPCAIEAFQRRWLHTAALQRTCQGLPRHLGG